MTSPSRQKSPLGWLVPLGFVVSLVGAVLPWYKPVGYAHHRSQPLGVVAHSWNGALPGIVAPVLLLIATVLVLRRVLRSGAATPGKNPVRSTGIWTLVLGVLAAVMVVASRGVVLSSTVSVNGHTIKLDKLAALEGAHSYSRGTQFGFYLTAAGVALALLGGLLLAIIGRSTPAVPAAMPGYQGAMPPQGYQPAPQGFGQTPPPPAPQG